MDAAVQKALEKAWYRVQEHKQLEMMNWQFILTFTRATMLRTVCTRQLSAFMTSGNSRRVISERFRAN